MPLMKNDSEKTARKIISRHFGPENSSSPNRLFSICTNEQVETESRIHTATFIRARYRGPK